MGRFSFRKIARSPQRRTPQTIYIYIAQSNPGSLFVPAVSMFVGSESMKKRPTFFGFVGEGLIWSPPSILFGGGRGIPTLTPVVALQSALRFMSRRAHCFEAGINAVTLVCSPAHNSKSFSFSKNPIYEASFHTVVLPVA